MRNKDLSGTVFLVLKKQSQADDARGAKGRNAVGEERERSKGGLVFCDLFFLVRVRIHFFFLNLSSFFLPFSSSYI